MIGSDEMLLLTLLGEEPPAGAVVASIGEELQRQERMGGPTFAKVEFDCVRRPAARRVLDNHEVDREAAENTGRCQPMADTLGRFADQPGILRICREDAAEIALSTGAAKQLMMC